MRGKTFFFRVDFFCDLRSLPLERLSRELCGMVSSMSVTSSSLIKTMSGGAEVNKVFSGMVDTGISLALTPERSAYSIVSLSRCFLMEFTEFGGHNRVSSLL